jgi:hypothetical protein
MFLASWAFVALKENATKAMRSILFINSYVLSVTKINPEG